MNRWSTRRRTTPGEVQRLFGHSETPPEPRVGSRCTSRDTQPGGSVTPQRPRVAELWETDTQTDMLPGKPRSAICVQRFDDSLSSAIHTTYRTWLRSSSMHEPRDPPLKVVSFFCHLFASERLVTSVKKKTGAVRWLSSLSASQAEATPNSSNGSR